MFSKKNLILLVFLVFAAIVVERATKWGFYSQVETTKVLTDTAIDAVPAIINVRSDYTFTLSSEEEGRVKSSVLALGAKIQANQEVLKIDPDDIILDIKILKAEIKNLKEKLSLDAQDSANLSKKEEDLKNYERLYAAGSYPELEMQRRRRDFSVFKESQVLKNLEEAQQLDAMEGDLERLERRLEKTVIYTPSDGIVTKIYAYPGELVDRGFSLAEVSSKAIVIEAKVNEENFSGITTGQTVNVRLLTYGNQLFAGTISQVLPTADKAKQQYTVLIELDIDPKLLIPGLSGEASIIRRKVANALVIPSRALMGDYVFKVISNEAILTPVKIGVRGLNHVEVKEGLNEGDVIITDDMESLKDGDLIRIKNK